MCQKHKILMSNFEVFEISLGVGLLGMSPLPGLSGNFEADIKHIINWRPTCIVSLTETNEMKDLGAKDLFLRLEKEKIPSIHFPIKDFGTVDNKREFQWEFLSKELRQQIESGGRVLIHCRGGCGRPGMLALRIMIEFGEKPDTALLKLRSIRPCLVETEAQEMWARSAIERR